MIQTLIEKHRPLLERAVTALAARDYWSPYPENARAYGESAAPDGEIAFKDRLNRLFELGQPGETSLYAGEISPYGVKLGTSYVVCEEEALVAAATAAASGWTRLGSEARCAILLEALERLNRRSFEIGHAVMMTTGQGWGMAFQAGGPHAQDRGLESVAAAWREQSAIPRETVWEKPQGKKPPLRMKKEYEIVGRGVALVIGCSTFPTWNTYPGLFAALATGNPTIVKPHSNAVLPVAITVSVLREVLAEFGLDPNVVTLAVTTDRSATQHLARHPEVKSIDYTGGARFGKWLLSNCPQAQVFAELAGVNHIVIDSTDQYRQMLANIAFSLSLYSGQMCTAPQAILVPAQGIQTDEGPKSFDEVAEDLGSSINALLSEPKVVLSVLGALHSKEAIHRVEEESIGLGEVVLNSRRLEHPDFPEAQVRTPLLLSCDASAEAAFMEERFGPISFVVRTHDTPASIALSERITRECGALTAAIYSTQPDVIDAMIRATLRGKVALSVNLTGDIFINQSAAFSDFHGSSGNPAANASYTDAAFVASRFHVIQRRRHI